MQIELKLRDELLYLNNNGSISKASHLSSQLIFRTPLNIIKDHYFYYLAVSKIFKKI